MCGIYLSVVTDYASSSATTAAAAAAAAVDDDFPRGEAGVDAGAGPPLQVPDWLVRRGPDHQGRITLEHQHSFAKERRKIRRRATLQASVLQMRQELVPQPVQLFAAAAAAEEEEQQPASAAAYLAWNGEVYQTVGGDLNDDHIMMELRDVQDHDVSDTKLVVDWMREALRQQQPQQGETTEEAESATTVRLQQQQQRSSAIAAQLARRMVNAEFAFVLLTPDTVYYGRDAWGRRSLLEAHQQQDDDDDDDDDDESLLRSTWNLASVADSDDNRKRLWKEVEPGRVHAYHWTTGTTLTPVSWQPQPILPYLLGKQSILVQPATEISSIEQASLVLQELLTAAVRRRLSFSNNECNISNNAVLFSGGLDSVVVAALALQVLPPSHTLVLLNVSFVDSKSNASTDTDTTPSTAADTRAAQASFRELRQLFPHHTIHLRHHQVDWASIETHEARIRALLHPKTTAMDFNIATALWFAVQQLQLYATNTDSASAAAAAATPRVLLTGLGADELLGGYGRHRTAWQHGRLAQELARDRNRLWDRNLGRDDRVLSDHGTEVRLPFLDAAVVEFCRQLDLKYVVDFESNVSGNSNSNSNNNSNTVSQPALGDKRVLRLVAERLGLRSAAAAVKRAIQFGSRVAHVSDKRRFGSRRKAAGTAAVVATATAPP